MQAEPWITWICFRARWRKLQDSVTGEPPLPHPSPALPPAGRQPSWALILAALGVTGGLAGLRAQVREVLAWGCVHAHLG